MAKLISADQIELVVKAGNSFSNAYNLHKKSVLAVYIPADWDGGDITIESSLPVTTPSWKTVSDSDGNAIGLTSVVADTIITMANNELQAMMQLKNIRLKGTTAVAADRTLILSLKEV